MGQGQFNVILDSAEQLGILRDFRRIRSASTGAVAQGEVEIEGRKVTLQVELGPAFPLELPRIALLPWDALGYIPHVAPNGTVCYRDPEGIVLDRCHPERVIKQAVEYAVDVLTQGAKGQNQTEFVDEFAACWAYLDGRDLLCSLLDPQEDVERVFIVSRDQQLILVARNRAQIGAYYRSASIPQGLSLSSNALYLPLQSGTFILPPRRDQPFWTVEEARNLLLSGLSGPAQEQLKKLVHPIPKSTEYVIARLPRPSGGESLFGLRFEGVGERHPLHPDGTAQRVIPVQIERIDQEHLVGRGGGDAGLDGQRVLLVGGGAVGGHIAFALARSGVLNLTLVDHDVFVWGNTFRHVLGYRHLGKAKSVALKEAIEGALPYVRVTAVTSTIEEALRLGNVVLTDYDLIVLATGNPTVELMVNARLARLEKGPSAVIAWVEPLGIGGHVLLVNNGSQPGCFECLYTTPEGTWNGENRAAFANAEQTQPFGRAWDGCGSLHTPFASSDAEQTAVLAARLAVEALTGEEVGNPLISWKGNATAFTAAGFELSTRFAFPSDELHRLRYAYCNGRCPICGNADERAA